MTEWNTNMDEAPNDGTALVGCWLKFENGAAPVWVQWLAYRIEENGMGIAGISGTTPTAWMPLPAPPEQQP